MDDNQGGLAMAGIKETKEVVILGLTLAKTIADCAKDGTFGMGDIGSIIKLVPKIAPAVKDANQIPQELKDLDAAEMQELLDAVSAELGADYAHKEYVEMAAKGAFMLLQLVLELKKPKA